VTIRFEDRFDNNQNGWPTGPDGHWRVSIADGELALQNLTDSGTAHWVWTGPSIADGSFAVRLRFVRESDAEFLDTAGLILRLRRERFVCFGVNAARRLVVGERVPEGADRWRARLLETSSVVRPGTEPNLLEVVARGPRLEFKVNGRRVHVVDDAAITGTGQVGLFGVSPTRARFDDLVVREVPADPSPTPQDPS
jgi:hypothetical protein